MQSPPPDPESPSPPETVFNLKKRRGAHTEPVGNARTTALLSLPPFRASAARDPEPEERFEAGSSDGGSDRDSQDPLDEPQSPEPLGGPQSPQLLGEPHTSSGVSPEKKRLREPARRVVNIPDDRLSELDDTEVEVDDEDAEEPAASVYASPAKRVITKSARKGIKQLVIEMDVNGGACLLTMVIDPTDSRQAAHIIARRTNDGILTKLEWWWGMRYRTFFIDTRWNIILLRADWHLLLDGNHWALVPHHRHIAKNKEWRTSFNEKAENLKERKEISLDYAADEVFDYYLLPLTKEMARTVIARYEVVNDPDTVELFKYPFKNFPVLKSRCRPHFVVYSAGRKLTHYVAQFDPDDGPAALQELAKVANFGHPGNEAEVQEENLNSLNELIGAHFEWSSDPKVSSQQLARWKKSKKTRSTRA
ncbi:hypothetical protein C8F01DRAFT_1152949 [Mycena amicta]|nr:hypothetical protein C8F01DRAFT_1152949 [Mycena amicta]